MFKSWRVLGRARSNGGSCCLVLEDVTRSKGHGRRQYGRGSPGGRKEREAEAKADVQTA